MQYFKKFSKIFFAVAFVASLLFAAGCSTSNIAKIQDKPLKMDPAIMHGVLNNGMDYYIRENAEPQNRIQLRLVVKAGSCMEDDDQKGVAHFVEHLCFNGTEHFEKSAIVDYFEKIGMGFGPEVNAYTSFEETVYMLEIPADDPEILKTSLLVLHDWASAVSFDPEEVEKERGVIIEEWRMRTLGVQGRVSDKITKLLCKDSKFADRIPIGERDIIKSVPRNRIVDFYKKWYKPENMSIVAVGDIKSDVLESAIKEVMGTIPASEKKTQVPSYEIPHQKDKILDIMQDKELSAYEIIIFQQGKNKEPVTTVEQLRNECLLFFAMSIFNQRCVEKSNTADSTWLSAGVSATSFAHNSPVFMMDISPKVGQFTDAFKAFLDEYERFLNYGVSDSELERFKNSYLQDLKQSYTNRDKSSSYDHASNIVDYILTGRIYPSEEDNLKIGKEILSSITAEEILNVARDVFENRGTIMMIFSPQLLELPSKSEIMDIWQNYESESAKDAYVDDTGDGKLMERPEKKAKVISKRAIKELGANEYTFENGVKIVTKKTDFQKNVIEIYGVSKGGFYQVKEEDAPSANVAARYALLSGFGGKTFNQIQKIITPKNVSLNLNIGETKEYIRGTAAMPNITENLQLINLMFDKPQFTDEGWKSAYSLCKNLAETYGSNPMEVFSYKLLELVYGKTLYYAPMDKSYVAKMDQKTAERVYRERFGNPADFTFFFVGDFNEKILVDLCASYLGTLKTSSDYDELKYLKFPFPKKNVTEIVKKGLDEIGDVFICFSGELPQKTSAEQGFKDSFILDQLASLLEIRLREVIREDKSGSYNVSLYNDLYGNAERTYQFMIEFGCEPAREEELSAAVMETIRDVRSGNVSDELIAKLKESYARSFETSLRDNSWWLSCFSAELIFESEPLWFTDAEKGKKIPSEWITKEAIVDAANKYLSGSCVTAYLKSEN